jgi:hypothetical protein
MGGRACSAARRVVLAGSLSASLLHRSAMTMEMHVRAICVVGEDTAKALWLVGRGNLSLPHCISEGVTLAVVRNFFSVAVSL